MGHSFTGAAWGCGNGRAATSNQSLPNHDVALQSSSGPGVPGFLPVAPQQRPLLPSEPDTFFVCPTTEAGGRSLSADPMVIEADALGLPGHDVTTVSKAAITPDAVHPSLETVTFRESGLALHKVDEATMVQAGPNSPSPTASFINTVRGTSPSMLELGVIPTSPVSFRHKVAQPLPASVSTLVLIRRSARRTPSASAP
jgi:hypothetical protein